MNSDNESKSGTADNVSAIKRYDVRDVRDLIESYPLAWVLGACGAEASLLPLVGVFDDTGQLVELIGHFSRSNALNGVFAKDPKATILFKGPDAYVSPSDVGRRDWGPTWNYAQVRVQAVVSIEPDLTADAVHMLAELVERGLPEPWQPAELGQRYDSMIRRIIGFRAHVTNVDAVFKLGQTESRADFVAIISNLEDTDTVRWMQRFNKPSTG